MIFNETSEKITIIDYGSVMPFHREGDALPIAAGGSPYFQDASEASG